MKHFPPSSPGVLASWQQQPLFLVALHPNRHHGTRSQKLQKNAADDDKLNEQKDAETEGEEIEEVNELTGGDSGPQSTKKAKGAKKETKETEETKEEMNEVKGVKSATKTEAKAATGDPDAKVSEKEAEPESKHCEDMPVDFLKMRRGKLSADQEAKFRQGLANLPPESKKALQEWVNMTENSTWTLLGLNCLFLVFIAGVLTLAAAAIVGVFQINIFNPDVWREGISKLQSESGLWPKVAPAPRAHEITHDRHIDLAEL